MIRKFYDWYQLPTKTLRELQRYPEFILLKHNGDWSEIKPQCGEDKVVLLRTNNISYDVGMGAIVSLQVKKNFKVAVKAINMQYIEIMFVFPEENDEGFKRWSLEKIELYTNWNILRGKYRDEDKPRDIEEEIVVKMEPKVKEVTATVESAEKGVLHVVEPDENIYIVYS